MKFFVYFATFLLVCFTAVACQEEGEDEEALIDTGDDQLGKIQGSHAFTMGGLGEVGRKYFWFTGMPYAKPESYTSDNRFKPPTLWDGRLPDDSGDGVFHANGSKSIIHCPQNPVVELGVNDDISKLSPFELLKSYYSREGAEKRRKATSLWGREDCLIVTVSTPRLPKGESIELLPVIFFIHGGGFDAFWGSVFGGQRLLNHDVVLVTMNYRFGVLGSLNLGIEDAPGNAAVYDCIEALKWVQKYIHHFGGDKDRVTVSGQSAGAVLATTVFLSPLANGLIHGAIGDSGSALSVWANQKNPIQENLKVVNMTKCAHLIPANDMLPDDTQAQAIVDCMKALSLPELIKARDDYNVKEHLAARLGYDAFVPSVQKASLAAKVPLALPESPVEILKNKKQNDVPLMMGVTRHDGSFVFVSTFFDYLVANGLDSDVNFIRNEFLQIFMKGVGLEDPTGALMHSFQKAYLGDAANSDDIVSKFPGITDIHTAVGFKAGAYGLVEGHAKLNPNSYYYAFDYNGFFTTFEIAAGAHHIKGGVAHIDDLLYLFQLIPLVDTRDWDVSYRYVKYWVNFATYGNPNGPGNLDTPFPKYNAHDHRFLIINSTDKVGYHCRDTWFGNSLELYR